MALWKTVARQKSWAAPKFAPVIHSDSSRQMVFSQDDIDAMVCPPCRQEACPLVEADDIVERLRVFEQEYTAARRTTEAPVTAAQPVVASPPSKSAPTLANDTTGEETFGQTATKLGDEMGLDALRTIRDVLFNIERALQTMIGVLMGFLIREGLSYAVNRCKRSCGKRSRRRRKAAGKRGKAKESEDEEEEEDTEDGDTQETTSNPEIVTTM